MKLPFAAALILSCAVCQSASPLEMTATAKDVQTVSQEIRMGAENAALIAAITKVNKDMLAILKCNKKNMFYKPDDSTADADGCVGATVTTTTTDHSVDLANVDFDSYTITSHSSNRYSYFRWSYDGATKQLVVQAAMGQVKSQMTGAKLVDVKANYQVTKVVLKVGSGT